MCFLSLLVSLLDAPGLKSNLFIFCKYSSFSKSSVKEKVTYEFDNWAKGDLGNVMNKS